MENGEIVLSWNLSIHEKDRQNWWDIQVNADTGKIINKTNWVTDCTIEHKDHDHAKHVSTDVIRKAEENVVSMTGGYRVYPIPFESPFDGDRVLVNDPEDAVASPFGWHDTDGVAGGEFTTTNGNNANAYDDGDNQGYQPDGGATLTFDFPFNTEYSDGDQSEDGAITNLFYWSNIIHDVTYRYGFDAASGNFQVNNYGNGGNGGDAVEAQAQDGSGTCNANFGTPPDGTAPTMQMFVCNSRDGDVDNMVIVHEYGHGISNRLTGGGGNTGCLSNDEQMGEGWSDWYGLMLTMQAGDVGTERRPVGNWLVGQTVDGGGIRDFPYSTDLTIDPRTYDYIKTTSGPHPLGSTWTAILWEVTWDLIDQHGFDADIYTGTGGNNMAIALVTEGLKLQPCNPGFVDGRDGILAADRALYGGANQCLLWEAFARRGLGFTAQQGTSNNRTDNVEAFDIPGVALLDAPTSLCLGESEVNGLTGGLPEGGVYSGPGVTDDGNGITYSFDPTAAGAGTHTITYTATSLCTAINTATQTIEVREVAPILECKNATVVLDGDGNATITQEDVVANLLAEGYDINQTGTFAPIDISATGTALTLNDDQLVQNLAIGFDFTYFDETYTEFKISSNGFIGFGDEVSQSACCSVTTMPSEGGNNNIIAFAWSDLNPSAGGAIRYETTGVAPNRILVVEFEDVPHFSFGGASTDLVTAQVQLFEGSNKIEIHTTQMLSDGDNHSQGIENINGTLGGAVPGRNNEDWSITSNDYVSFTRADVRLPRSCGLEATVTLDIDTFDINNIGDNTVTVTATDTEGNTTVCEAIVTVEGTLSVEDVLVENAFELYPNPASDRITLRYTGDKSLENASIIDLNGKLINTIDLKDMQSEKNIDVAKLASGIYFIRINSVSNSIVKKLVIQ